jgi:hypothetical protein
MAIEILCYCEWNNCKWDLFATKLCVFYTYLIAEYDRLMWPIQRMEDSVFQISEVQFILLLVSRTS